jgi:D-glycero-D-manno-heptose 1,7-bisphosphate phosphatase
MTIVLLDRDGTIVRDTGYLRVPSDVELLPGAAPALAKLHDCSLAVISNQSGVGRGIISATEAAAVHTRVVELLQAHCVVIPQWLYCFHAPNTGCACRKPEPGLLFAAIRASNAPGPVFMIGDQVHDIIAGHSAHCTTIWLRSPSAEYHGDGAHYVASDLLEASAIVRTAIDK